MTKQLKLSKKAKKALGKPARPPTIRAHFDRQGTGLAANEIIVDSFAGGGGASSGLGAIEVDITSTFGSSQGIRFDLSPDIAINHDPEAIAMHKANHPDTKHYIEDVWDVDPHEACDGRPVGLAWFSPTCTHFSKAKGTALDASSIKIRGLAWVAVRWAAAVKPRIICLENVEEFAKWGPLHRQHTDGCSDSIALKRGTPLYKGKQKIGIKSKCRDGCRLHKPIKERSGETFRAWVKRLEKLGYVVEWKLLRACDYGAPTTRRRLFLVARRDGRPIAWPAPTHGPGRALAHRAAAECIDWSVPCPSIFERDRPLAPKTLARIARGIQTFVLDAARPFIVPATHGDTRGRPDTRTHSVDEPVRTLTTRGAQASIIVPYMVHRSNGERAATATAAGQAPRIYDVQKPMGTIVAQGQKHAACVALLIKNNGGNNDACGASGQELTRPIDTIACKDQKSLTVAHLVRYNTENSEGSVRGQSVDDPMSTLDTSNRLGIVASHLVKMRGTSESHVNSSGSSMEDPMPTITASGTHVAAVAAFLVRYNGKSTGQGPEAPLGTLDTTDRYGLVTVTIEGEEYILADIGMRMLTPRELYRAQGFREDYIIDPIYNDKPLTKTAQIRMCGNSVPPQMATVIASAQLAVLA